MFHSLISHLVTFSFLFVLVVTPITATQQPSPANNEREAALKLLQEKQYAEAAKAWRTFLSDSKNQKDAEAWLYLGIALYRNKEIDAAGDALKKAVKLNNKSEAAHANYAAVLYAAHKFKDAEKEVNETLKLNANNHEAMYLRVLLRYNKGMLTQALADIDRLLQLNPQFAPAYLLKAQAIIGQLYTNSGKLKMDFPPEWKDTFLVAAQYTEQYLQRSLNSDDADFWRERIQALRFYGGSDNSLGCEKATMNLRPEILYQEKAKYTEEARFAGIRGTVRLRAIFDVNGQIKHILPMNHLAGGLTEEAIKAMQKMRFKPAVKDGKPICVSMIVEFAFELLR